MLMVRAAKGKEPGLPNASTLTSPLINLQYSKMAWLRSHLLLNAQAILTSRTPKASTCPWLNDVTSHLLVFHNLHTAICYP